MNQDVLKGFAYAFRNGEIYLSTSFVHPLWSWNSHRQTNWPSKVYSLMQATKNVSPLKSVRVGFKSTVPALRLKSWPQGSYSSQEAEIPASWLKFQSRDSNSPKCRLPLQCCLEKEWIFWFSILLADLVVFKNLTRKRQKYQTRLAAQNHMLVCQNSKRKSS